MEDSYHHGALREALLEAALETLRQGEPLTLRGVARRAGVSHAAPYHHFADRRALLAGVAREGMVALRERVTSAALVEEEPRRQLLAAGVAYVRFALEQPALFRLIFSAELAERDDLPELQEAFLEVRRTLLDMSGRLLNGADPEDVRLWALRGWSTVHGLAKLILDNQVAGVRSVEDAERVTRQVLLAGVPAVRG
jgi:AcrR family transcriptional regulator